jgi:SAM-dependent methyltransferase
VSWNVDDYVRLRTGGDDAALDLFADAHELDGRRVLDLGCGPGRAAAALANRGAIVTGVDATAEMLAAAREIVPAGVELVEGRAEELPFADASFDAALSSFVVHLLDRPKAFAEVRRVLTNDGLYWIKTSDPATIPSYWAAPLFPSYPKLESARFPDEELLRTDLTGAGFARVEVDRFVIERTFSRDEALTRLASGAFSTFNILPPEEREEGLRRAPEVLSDPVEYSLTLLLVTAHA